MKKYSLITRTRREADDKIVRFQDEMDALISSEEFINTFKGYVEDIAMYKTSKGYKYRRSTEYAAVGVLDLNDLIQEGYLAFLEAYESYKEREGNFDTGGEIWTFLKKTTILNYERALRQKKDGIRIPEYAQPDNVNVLTSIFGKLEELFSKNVSEVAVSKWDTDLTGYFLEVHMDEHLDFTRDGNRDYKKNERAIIKSLYGIDEAAKTYKELSEAYQTPEPTLRQIKKRAIKRLQSEDSKEKIANFLHEYRIQTNADTEKYRK